MLPPGSESAVDALFSAPGIAAARDILRLHPQPVDGTVAKALRAVAADIPDRAARERVGRTTDLIRGALTSGLDQAFETMSAAPPPAPSAFELVRIGPQFLTEPDDHILLHPRRPSRLIDRSRARAVAERCSTGVEVRQILTRD